MSQLEDLYNKAGTAVVKEATLIPKQAVNFIDVPNKFQKEFTLKRAKGAETTFTDVAKNYFEEELNQFVSSDATLHRWRPGKTYGAPGSV